MVRLGGSSQSLNGAPLRRAPGFAGQDRQIVQRVVANTVAAEDALMRGHHLAIEADDDPIGIGPQLDRPVGGLGLDAVAVAIEADQTGL